MSLVTVNKDVLNWIELKNCELTWLYAISVMHLWCHYENNCDVIIHMGANDHDDSSYT